MLNGYLVPSPFIHNQLINLHTAQLNNPPNWVFSGADILWNNLEADSGFVKKTSFPLYLIESKDKVPLKKPLGYFTPKSLQFPTPYDIESSFIEFENEKLTYLSLCGSSNFHAFTIFHDNLHKRASSLTVLKSIREYHLREQLGYFSLLGSSEHLIGNILERLVAVSASIASQNNGFIGSNFWDWLKVFLQELTDETEYNSYQVDKNSISNQSIISYLDDFYVPFYLPPTKKQTTFKLWMSSLEILN